MTDIVVTTPKWARVSAAQEAHDCIENNGGFYFRRLLTKPGLNRGERVFYVEDGFLRGFAICCEVTYHDGKWCDTTKRYWEEGWYVYMPAKSWTWIEPIPMRGFQGYQYARGYQVKEMGGWLDPMPGTLPGLGEYYTPANIDKIVDPAVGTGGFLVDVIGNPK